jgi:hypothetical protein
MRRTLAVSLFALVCSTGVHAQAVVGSGAITGLVKDVYGDGIPECTIALTNKVVGLRREAMTSDDGIFEMPALVPAGSYGLKVTRKGYADWELPGFDLSLGETLNFTITMYADKVATPAEAQRSLKAVQDSKISLSGLINDDQLYALPTTALQLDPLVLLAPAVVESPAGVLVFRGEPFRNVFLLDGISITNNYFANRPGVAPFVMQESASQMQVISAAAPADFGPTAGGIVNMVTKTGTNALHASAYDYYAQNSWDSPDFFGNGFIPTGRQNHAGISVGLPISTDELFLFGNMERINDSSQGMNRIANPLLTAPGGNSALTAGCTATSAQCGYAATFIDQQLNAKVPQSEISTIGFARMDFRPNERQSFTLAGAIQSERGVNSLYDATVAANGGMLGSNATSTDSTRYGAFGWTDVLSGTRVNEFHGDWFRDTQTAATDPTLLPASSTACPACGTGPLAITIAGTPVGGNPAVPFNMREQRYGGTDTFSMTMASHTIKFGGDIWRNEDTQDQLYARYGTYNYASFSAFATDFTGNVKAARNYATFDQTLGTSTTDLTSMMLAGFAEDTWKASTRLTVNAGVRYEKWQLPQPTEPNAANYLSEFIPAPKTNFAPRVGVAYLIDNRTVVRVGVGSYYEPFYGQLIHDLWTGGGVYQSYYELTPTEVGSPVFPKVLATTATTTLNSALLGEFYAAPRFKNPYTIHGAAGIERRLNRYVSLAANFVQSEGKRIPTGSDQNLIGGVSTSETYTINNAQGTAVNTYVTPVWNSAAGGHRVQVDNEGGSRYRAGTAQVRTAPLFGLSVQASYTWSHAFDDLSGPLVANYVIPANYFPSSYTGDNGPSAFDQRNRAVVNFTWQPKINSKTDVLSRFVLNGWLVSGIGTYSSSMFVTPTVEVQGQQFTGITMDYSTSLNGTGGWSRVPFQDVNTLPLGTHANVDARVSKSLPFTERFKGQLTIEAFNAANHENVSAVNTIAFTSVSGVLKPVTGLGTPIASYGYPFGTTARHIQVAFRLEF